MEKKIANGKDNILKEARSLLSLIQNKGQETIFQDSSQAAEALRCSITLIESFHRSVKAGRGPFPSSPDWKVVNAILVLLVRLGICPYLSPGVGIAREKLSGNAGALAAASAISKHLSGFAISDSLRFQKMDTLPASGSHILFVSVEVLASLVWDQSTNLEGSHERLDTAMSSLGALVVHSFLWHMMAGYLQLACREQSSDDGFFKQIACERIKLTVEELPVRQVVEACFVLLHRSSPGPPEWLKSEVGKQLSKLVMRRGGLAIVLEELVGRATEGNVEIYDKVAAHLAKTPKSIATVDDYFKAICPQLLPLLLLRSQLKDPKAGEISLAALKNVHFTAVSLACKLFSVEPGLAVDYLLEPLLRPLRSWSSAHRGMGKANQDFARATRKKEMDGKQFEGDISPVTENQLVDTLVQISVLLTAGHRGFSVVNEVILLETKDIAPLLFKLHSQLEAADSSSTSWTAGGLHSKGKKTSPCKASIEKDEGKPASSHKIVGKGIANGFLEKGLEVESAIELTADQQSALSRLRFALADFVMVHANQPLELALPTVLSLLFQPELSIPSWPGEQGEIWDSLSLETAPPSNSAMYLSRLLLAIENWPLAVALVGELLQKVLDFRQAMIVGEGFGAIELLGHMQDFEILNNEVGSIALEQFPSGAASLVKVLLESQNVINDEGLVELVLHMVNSVLKGFRSCKEADGYLQNSSGDQKDSVVLADMAVTLERVCNNACLSEKYCHFDRFYHKCGGFGDEVHMFFTCQEAEKARLIIEKKMQGQQFRSLSCSLMYRRKHGWRTSALVLICGQLGFGCFLCCALLLTKVF